MTILICFVTLEYGFKKFNRMIDYSDTDYKTVTEPDALDMSQEFSASQIDSTIIFKLARND